MRRSRAGEQSDRGLDPTRQPNSDAMTGPDAVAGEVRRQPVGGSSQPGPFMFNTPGL
jgi:hypothetical protein